MNVPDNVNSVNDPIGKYWHFLIILKTKLYDFLCILAITFTLQIFKLRRISINLLPCGWTVVHVYPFPSICKCSTLLLIANKVFNIPISWHKFHFKIFEKITFIWKISGIARNTINPRLLYNCRSLISYQDC